MKNNYLENLFADLCEYTFLSGFTFHSPKINDPTEKEIGDIVIWVRTQLIVFELVWREGEKYSTSSFIKRIGEKRELGRIGLPEDQIAGMKEGFKELVPAKRIGTTGEVAKIAALLASPDSSFIVGEEITVDGGLSNL